MTVVGTEFLWRVSVDNDAFGTTGDGDMTANGLQRGKVRIGDHHLKVDRRVGDASGIGILARCQTDCDHCEDEACTEDFFHAPKVGKVFWKSFAKRPACNRPTFGFSMRALLFALFLVSQGAMAQLAIRNGVGIPTRDTLRVLIIFAEVDFTDGPCPGGQVEDFKGDWPKDRTGKTMVPTYAADFLDADVHVGQEMKGFITRFYHEASFGSYLLLGDHLPDVVTIPCRDVRVGTHGLDQVLKVIAENSQGEPKLVSAKGRPLADFDKWVTGVSGVPKVKQPDGMIDLLYIIWRNNCMLTGARTRDHAGFGVTSAKGGPIGDMKGVSNLASFNVSTDPEKGSHITISEHLHGIFGGNHWHSAGGRGMHTFLMPPASYGLTAQFGGTMKAASGWDRWMMEWRPDGKQHAVSALDLSREEVNTEWVSVETHPQGATFILRDHISSGDAIRIKLPYIDWEKNGDVKNQYLWLENRQMKTHSDRYLSDDCANNGGGRFPKGTPGIYAYIQVGKDIREGDQSIYSSTPSHPNGLASPFFPLPAEGRFDFRFRTDRLQPADHSIACNWGNENVPKDMRRSLPNPLTGLSDLYCQMDQNGDGKLYSGDRASTGMSKMKGDSAIHDYHVNGDWLDAFSPHTGNMQMAMYTNPAPLPVYTYSTNLEFKRYGNESGKMPSFENRVVWLNGLHIQFTSLAGGEMQVDLRWDGYDVLEDVRWCGTIFQSPHVFDASRPSLRLAKKKKMLLARGQSPQYHEALGKDRAGEWQFADPTHYKVLKGAVMELDERSHLLVSDDSRLEVEQGATLIIRKNAQITVSKGARLTIAEGAVVQIAKGGRIVER